MKILLIEDEPVVLEALRRMFERRGHAVTPCETGAIALEKLAERQPDVVVLDWGLPDLPGPDLVRELRSRDVYVPVLMLTGRTAREDAVDALSAGADDFVRKTEEPEVLAVRCEALVRRARYPREEKRIEAEGVVIDEPTRSVTVDGRAIDLTKTEFALLAALAESTGAVISRAALIRRLWGNGHGPVSNSLEQIVTRVRKKLGRAGKRLRAIRAEGYVLDAKLLE